MNEDHVTQFSMLYQTAELTPVVPCERTVVSSFLLIKVIRSLCMKGFDSAVLRGGIGLYFHTECTKIFYLRQTISVQ